MIQNIISFVIKKINKLGLKSKKQAHIKQILYFTNKFNFFRKHMTISR